MNADPSSPRGKRERLLTGPATVAAILLLFWLALAASLRDKSLTFDEILHATSGFSDWRFGDYGIQPESNLPPRVAGLPLALGPYKPPATDSADWRNSRDPNVGYAWFYEMGNDAARMAAAGRAACGLLAVALGAVVWAWSRKLFGPRGGMVSLMLYVLNPTILANGALMTSDTAAALFFLAASWAWWAVLHRMSAGRLLGSALLAGGLFVSKMSAVLIIPVMLALAIARLLDARPLPVAFGRWHGEIVSRARQAVAFVMAGLGQALIVAAVIWSFYGFRFSAFPNPAAGDRFVVPWEYVLGQPDPLSVVRDLQLSPEQAAHEAQIFQAHGAPGTFWSNDAVAALDEIQRTVLTREQGGRLEAIRRRPPDGPEHVVDFLRRHELLPEAWLYGFATVLSRAQVRQAFWNGRFSDAGWPGFFPYAFLVKTPLGVFGICGLALAAGWRSWKAKTKGLSLRGPRAVGRQFYDTLPLWVFLAIYWLAAIPSHLNIGHRHLVPVYAPMFVLCGASAGWLGGKRWAGAALCGLLVLLAAESFWFFPNYLAYFNGIVRPSDAYRHLVDSSLDWGQELPAARRYIEQHPEGAPFYLSYFGMASPAYHGVDVRLLYSYGGPYLRGSQDLLMTKVPPDRVDEEVARLQRERRAYDLMGVAQIGDDAYAVFLRKASELRLAAGTYLVSATMLQPIYYSGPRGPWNERYEKLYQGLRKAIQPLLAPDPGQRAEAFRHYDIDALIPLLDRFEQYRFARLALYLRQRQPDAMLNYSILVYRLTDADLARALD